MEADSHSNLPDVIPKAGYWNIAIDPDKRGVYYSREGNAPRVYYHALGTDPAKDQFTFGEGYGPEPRRA